MKTRREQIAEAAQAEFEKYEATDLVSGFKAGAEWADQNPNKDDLKKLSSQIAETAMTSFEETFKPEFIRLKSDLAQTKAALAIAVNALKRITLHYVDYELGERSSEGEIAYEALAAIEKGGQG